MQKRTSVFLVACLVLIGLVFTLPRFATKHDTINNQPFPKQLANRLELRAGETVRSVELYPDRITPRHAVATNSDGTLSEYWFRPDGTLKTARTEFVDPTSGKRSLRRYAEIAADGRTYILDLEYYADGTRAKELHLVDPSTQHKQYFFANGAVFRDQLISRDARGWKMTQEDVFRADKTLASRLRPLEHDGWLRDDLAANGTLMRHQQLDPYQTKFVDSTFFPGGVTVSRLVEQDSYGTKITLYRPDGTLAEQREWAADVDKSSMTVKTFDRSGKPLFTQYWGIRGDKYFLASLKEFRPDGSDDRMLYFAEDGKTVSMEIVYDPVSKGAFVRNKYRADGTLETSEEIPSGKSDGVVTHFGASANKRALLSSDRLAFRPYKAPPQLIEYSPPED